MSNPLTQCGVCSKPFIADDCPEFPQPLVFTSCYHIFHKYGLVGWIKDSKKDCPLCKTAIYPLQLGKDFKTYWTIFLKALEHDPTIVLDTLDKSDHKNDSCAVCLDDLPLIPLRYDAKTKRLVHDTCDTSQTPSLLMQDLAKIVKKIVEKDPELQKKFTPRPPSFKQRIFTDYPFLPKLGLIGAISIGLFILSKPPVGNR